MTMISAPVCLRIRGQHYAKIYDIVLPEGLRLVVHEEDATTAYLVLPRSKKLTDDEMEATSGGVPQWY